MLLLELLRPKIVGDIRGILDRGKEFQQAIMAIIAPPGRGTSIFSTWPNFFVPVSQNESGWPAAAASRKTGIKFACPSGPAGLDV
jgi:hypothetical protein